jgi:hypothetical protein
MADEAISGLPSYSSASNSDFIPIVDVASGVTKRITKGNLLSGLSITTDAVPTNGSTNPVESNGVFDAIQLQKDSGGTNAISLGSRLLYDSTGSAIANFNSKSTGFGVISGSWAGYLKTTALTTVRTYELPDKDGTFAMLDDITGGGAWGSITGTLSDQTDLQTALDARLNKSGGTVTGTIVLSNLTASTILELDGSKNIVSATKGTAYNKNFGTGSGTVAEGNDSRITGALQTSSFTDAAVTSKLITGFVSGAGTVSATDTILEAIQKLDGNITGALTPVGDIFNNTFADAAELNDYTSVGGGTFAFNVSGGLDVSGGTGDYTKYFKHDWQTILNKWEIVAEFENVTDGNGIAFGLPDLYARIDLNTAGNRGLYYIVGGPANTVLATAATPVSFTNGDTLRINFKRTDTYVTLKVTNVTTDVIYNVISYTQTLGTTVSNSLQNIGPPAIYAYGGSQTVTRFNYKTSAIQNCDIVFLGDSNTEGWGQGYDPVRGALAGDINTSFAYRVQSLSKLTVEKLCRKGIDVAGVYACIDEILLLRPKTAVIALGTNNAISSQTQPNFAIDYDLLVTALVDAGINVVINKVIPHATGATNTLITSYNTGLVSTYGSRFLINETNTTLNATAHLADGVHMNMDGAFIYALVTTKGLSSIGLTPSLTYGTDDNYYFSQRTFSASNRIRNRYKLLNNGSTNALGPTVAYRMHTGTAGAETTAIEWYNYLSGTENLSMVLWGKQLGINLAAGTQPSANLHVKALTIGEEVFRVESTATNDDPYYGIVQGRITTTDATVTTLRQISVTTSATWTAFARVIARRTGGAAGAADDAAEYEIRGTIKTVGGVATLVANTTTVIYEDQAGWDAVFDISGGALRIRVTGAVNNTITWHCPELKYSAVGS